MTFEQTYIYPMVWFMNSSTDLRRGRNCVFLIHVHLVFVIKYRWYVFTKPVLEELRKIFQNVCKDFSAELAELEGEKDHVHLVVNYPPKVSVSKLVNSLKGGIITIDQEKQLHKNSTSSMG